MKFAIIGKGFIYHRHKKAIEDLGHEVYLTCDINPDTKPDFIDWLEMYHHPKFDKVDAVIICTPNYLHAVMAREALLRGKKVLCEKPLSIDTFDGLEKVNTVLQLRHHPALKGLEAQEVYVEAKMFRDEHYWDSWKGDDVKSGGVLYNLGIHYIDLLIYLLGEPVYIDNVSINDKLAKGMVVFKDGKVGSFHIEIIDNRAEANRIILVDGKNINLSNQDNLSYEDLHKYVYWDFINGNGIPLKEAEKSLKLVKDLKSI